MYVKEKHRLSCKGRKGIMCLQILDGDGKSMKKKDFRGPSTGARARRTLENAYLCMLSDGARAPAGAAAAKKKTPGRMIA